MRKFRVQEGKSSEQLLVSQHPGAFYIGICDLL